MTSQPRAHGFRGFWRLVNAPMPVDARGMRLACTVFLVAYAVIAVARYEQAPGFFWSRLAICLYAGLGTWLARDMIRHSVVRAYAIGAALLLPLQAAWVDALLGNHVGEVTISAVATFCPLVFLQAGADVALVLPALVIGHAAILASGPVPAVPMLTIAVLLGGALATGASAAFQSLLYRGRWHESLARLEDALAASAEWQNRYEAAIVASGQILYDWDASTGQIHYRGACPAILGFSEDELLTEFTSWRDRVHPDDVQPFEARMRAVVAAKRPFQLTYRARRKDGAYVVIENRGHFILDDAGTVAHMIGFLSDVTERAEQTATTAALARVGQELISSLETPVLLERLCRVTAEVLECEFSTTWLWKSDQAVYEAIASYGLAPEQWEGLRLLVVPSDPSTPLISHLLRDGLAQVRRDGAQFPLVASMLAHYDVRVALCVALRRGDTIVGIHAAGYRTRASEFTPAQERLARGVAQLASMALANATLFEELERAGRLKSEFVSTMSHELRTPLNVILGYTDMLADQLVADEQRGLLARVRRSSMELLDMIDATLSLNRLAAGTDVPRIEPTPLASLWSDLRAEFAALPRQAGVDLRWEPTGEIVLNTDRRRLKIVVKNLVGNALKFTSTGEVVVRCDRTPTGAVVSVRDTGIGIPGEHVPHIFEMFRQVDSSDTRSYSGAGLGLYIVRQLVDQLGGTITVDTALGSGSTFRVTLPDGPRSPFATAAA